MKAVILALCLSVAALGLSGFTTVRTFLDEHAEIPPASSWSSGECQQARETLDRLLHPLRAEQAGSAGPLQIAINDNCAP